jgi:ATP-binding cassette subfamily B protein
VEAIGSAAVALLVWYGGGEVIQGTLSFGALVAFIEYTNRFFLPIRDLGAKYTVMQAAMVSAERVFGLLDTPPSVTSPPAGKAAGPRRGPAERGPAVEFRHVWFAYDREHWVLRDCSFQVARGEQVALVGPTGQGKTTVARLMTRAYDVTRGQVLVDGRDVREWDLPLGREGATPADEVARAVEAASAGRLIDSLPGGLDAGVRERGANLSQGQRQLLAIARALLYNPPVLALDEATSSVDPDSEIAIRDGLARLLSGRTSVVIAHRLSTIRLADRILVLHHGAVQESGRHAELMARGGYYARLHELAFGLAGA